MRKWIGILLLAVLLLCLSGCGGGEPRVSGGAVSGSTVSGAALEEGDEGEAISGGAVDISGEIVEPKAEEQTALPAEGPAPVEPQEVKVDEEQVYHCTVSIQCGTVLDNMEDLTAGKEEIIPEDGVILPATEVEFHPGENAFDALLRATKDNKIHMEFVSTPLFNSNYIEGIGNLYEFDCSPLSGWMYKVNDWFPNYGCSRYELSDGDVIEWIYTCDLGRDIGGDLYEQQQ